MPESTEAESIDGAAESEGLVDQTGRTLGTRALQTRQRILDAAVAELAVKPMRDLRVIDIARRVGSSPATFYQYFKDIEDVVLQLADSVLARTSEGVEAIQGDWAGEAGLERARHLVRRAIDHYQEFGPILRVRNTAADEGDERFRDVRERAILPMMTALSEQIAASQARASASPESDGSDALGHIDPRTGGMLIFAMFDRAAMYFNEMVELGIDPEQIVETGATILHSVMNSRR